MVHNVVFMRPWKSSITVLYNMEILLNVVSEDSKEFIIKYADPKTNVELISYSYPVEYENGDSGISFCVNTKQYIVRNLVRFEKTNP